MSRSSAVLLLILFLYAVCRAASKDSFEWADAISVSANYEDGSSGGEDDTPAIAGNGDAAMVVAVVTEGGNFIVPTPKVCHLELLLQDPYSPLWEYMELCSGQPVKTANYRCLFACEKGLRRAAISIIEARMPGFDIDYKQGILLRTACEHNDTVLVISLLRHGASVHTDGAVEGLSSAAAHGNLLVVKSLVKRGASAGAYFSDALIKAHDARHFDVGNFLLSHGANINERFGHILMDTIRDGQVNDVHNLLGIWSLDFRVDDDNAIVVAGATGDVQKVALLLSRGLDAATHDSQALIEAAARGHTAAVAMLYAAGASATASDGDALIRAAGSESIETAAFLLETKVFSLVARRMAVKSAAKSGQKPIIEMLLADRDFVLPLELGKEIMNAAIANGHMEVVYFLIDGHYVECLNVDEKALAAAARKGHVDIIESLHELDPFISGLLQLLLKKAIKGNQIKFVRYFLSQPGVNQSTITFATENMELVMTCSTAEVAEMVISKAGGIDQFDINSWLYSAIKLPAPKNLQWIGYFDDTLKGKLSSRILMQISIVSIIESGSIEAPQWLIERNWMKEVEPKKALKCAIKSGSVEMVRLVMSRYKVSLAPLASQGLIFASKKGSNEMMRFILRTLPRGYGFDYQKVCKNLASSGNIEVLRHLRDFDVPMERWSMKLLKQAGLERRT